MPLKYTRAELLRLARWYDGIAASYREGIAVRSRRRGFARDALELQVRADTAAARAVAYRTQARMRLRS